jgi:hypothetical protein
MPEPTKGESREDFVGRCVPAVMGEGVDQDAAVGKCEGIFDSHVAKAQGAVRKAISEPKPAGPFTGATTAAQDGHKHAYAVDASGNGKAAGSGHVHEIAGWLVGMTNGHTHLLDRVMQGAAVEKEHGMGAAERIKTAIDHLNEHPNYYRVLESVGLSMTGEVFHEDVSRETATEVEKAMPIGATSERKDGTYKKVGANEWKIVSPKSSEQKGKEADRAKADKNEADRSLLQELEGTDKFGELFKKYQEKHRKRPTSSELADFAREQGVTGKKPTVGKLSETPGWEKSEFGVPINKTEEHKKRLIETLSDVEEGSPITISFAGKKATGKFNWIDRKDQSDGHRNISITEPDGRTRVILSQFITDISPVDSGKE